MKSFKNLYLVAHLGVQGSQIFCAWARLLLLYLRTAAIDALETPQMDAALLKIKEKEIKEITLE